MIDPKIEQDKLVKMYERGIERLEAYPELYQKQAVLRDSLQALVRMADGYHPRAWVEQYADGLDKPIEQATMSDIARIIDPTLTVTAFFPAGTAIADENKWRKSQGQTYRVWSASIDYGATGEGSTKIFAAGRAYSMGEFYLWLAAKAGYYFAYGADIFDGPPPENDRVADFLVTAQMRRFLQSERDAKLGGHVDVMLEYHVNYS